MTADTRTLHRKLAQIMYEADRIPKNGTAPREMGGYKFVQVGDAADYIRKALAEKVITMIPTGVQVVGQADRPTKSGGSMTTVDLITTWTLTDGESGESIQIQSFGAGADGGDKYSGKASTSAMKYALLTGFLLSTGEDSELGHTPERAPQPAAEPGGPDDGWTGPRTPQGKPDDELTLLGIETRTGTIAKGEGIHSGLAIRQTPTGAHIGFRLVISKDKALPEVCAEGPLGDALLLLAENDPRKLVGQKVTATGQLFTVRRKDKGTTYRMILTKLVGPDYEIPAPDFPPDEQAEFDKALAAATT